MPRKTDLEASIRGLDDVEAGIWWRPQEGKNFIRILPAWTTKGDHAGKFFFKSFLHYGFRGEGRSRAFPCLTSLDPQATCPACEFAAVLAEEGSDDAAQIARRLRRQSRYYVNLIDRRTPGLGVKIYGMRRSQMRVLRGYLQDPDYGDFTDAEEGRDLVIERTGTGLQTRYELRPRAKTSPIGVDEWEKQLHKLSKVVVEPITEKAMIQELKISFGGLFTKAMGIKTEKPQVPETEPEEDEEEEATTNSGRPKPKSKSKPQVTEIDEEEEDEEE